MKRVGGRRGWGLGSRREGERGWERKRGIRGGGIGKGVVGKEDKRGQDGGNSVGEEESDGKDEGEIRGWGMKVVGGKGKARKRGEEERRGRGKSSGCVYD